MEARQVEGITASVNMWASLADNDPGDSGAAKRSYREPKNKKGDVDEQAPAVANVPDVNREVQSNGAGGRANGHKEKKPRKERRKQRKKEPPALTESKEAEASGSKNGSNNSDQNDGEDSAAAAGGSCCRAVVGGLLKAALPMAFVAVWLHVAASAAPAGRPI